MPHTICTFNVNNLFLRYRFGQGFPGDMSGKSQIEESLAATFGFLPMNQPGGYDIYAPEMRALAAQCLQRGGTKLPDVICFQEVESLLALRAFNAQHLKKAYKYAMLVDSHDLRQIDVAVLSNLEILGVRSHVDDLQPGTKSKLFSRDCLEITLALNRSGSERVTLLVNHLKSRLSKTPAERRNSDAKRQRQAEGIVKILRERFAGAAFGREHFAVVGDLNDAPDSGPILPLTRASGLVSALDRIPSAADRWTHYWRGGGSVAQLDHVLLSPALDRATAGAVPHLERRGIGFANILADGKPGPRQIRVEKVEDDPAPVRIDFRFPRFPAVNTELAASDHCPIFFEVP